MAEHKQNLRDRRNAGESVGDHRGTVRERPADWHTRDLDELELALQRIVHARYVDVPRAFEADLAFIVLELNDATVCDFPF
jgi:hypothetical protein